MERRQAKRNANMRTAERIIRNVRTRGSNVGLNTLRGYHTNLQGLDDVVRKILRQTTHFVLINTGGGYRIKQALPTNTSYHIESIIEGLIHLTAPRNNSGGAGPAPRNNSGGAGPAPRNKKNEIEREFNNLRRNRGPRRAVKLMASKYLNINLTNLIPNTISHLTQNEKAHKLKKLKFALHPNKTTNENKKIIRTILFSRLNNRFFNNTF
jgi:hypothetical protein